MNALLTWHQVCLIRVMHEQGLRLVYDGACYRLVDIAGKLAKHDFVSLSKAIRPEVVKALIRKGYLERQESVAVITKKVEEYFAERVA